MIRHLLLMGGALSSVLLSGCGAKPPLGLAPHVELLQDSELPVPSASDYGVHGRVYAVGPYDQIRVSVFGVQGFEREIQVDAAGHFQYPFVGIVDANGRTPEHIAEEIADRLRGRVVRDPQVTVNLVEIQSHRVTVDGEVIRPGVYPVVGGMTLMQAVALAQGPSDFADREDVVVFRNVGGQQYAALFNLEAIRRGNYEDPDVYANDIVVVGESPSLRLFDKIARVAPLLTTPIIVLTRN